MPQEKSVLIVGVGSIGLRHLRCFRQTDRVRVSICEIDPVLRRRVAEEHQIDRCYADLDGALADRHDAAVIATPAHLHVPVAIRLAEAGLHLLIEKPLSTNMEGIDTLQEIVRQPAIGGGRGLRGSRQSGSAGDEGGDRVGPFRSARPGDRRVGAEFPHLPARDTDKPIIETAPPAAGQSRMR